MRAVLVAVVLAGCMTMDANLRGRSAGLVGCDARTLAIGPWDSHADLTTWTATCPDGSVYYCAQPRHEPVTCTPGR